MVYLKAQPVDPPIQAPPSGRALRIAGPQEIA